MPGQVKPPSAPKHSRPLLPALYSTYFAPAPGLSLLYSKSAARPNLFPLPSVLSIPASASPVHPYVSVLLIFVSRFVLLPLRLGHTVPPCLPTLLAPPASPSFALHRPPLNPTRVLLQAGSPASSLPCLLCPPPTDLVPNQPELLNVCTEPMIPASPPHPFSNVCLLGHRACCARALGCHVQSPLHCPLHPLCPANPAAVHTLLACLAPS